MNKHEIIKKLTLLKKIKPTQPVLEDMKKNISLQMQADVTSVLQKFFINVSLVLKSQWLLFSTVTFALLLIVFLCVASTFLPKQLHNIILSGKLAFALNQYDRASIALADTTQRFGSGKVDNIKDVSQSTKRTNTELSNLKLKGEKGKYTAQQCYAIYQKYLSYLKRENLSISAENTQSLSELKSQLSTYEELAEKKLHMYNKL